MLAFAAWSSTTTVASVVLAYLGSGLAVGAVLARKGHSAATAWSALAVWPMLLPLLESPQPRLATGPFAARIESAFAALREVLVDPAAGEVPWAADLDGLRQVLLRSDERLALVDGLLADADDSVEGAAAQLRSARAHTAGEIEAVLAEVAQLRLQVGLVALAGNAEAVRERLGELVNRARALDEVASIGREEEPG